jgi:hypothetical protein
MGSEVDRPAPGKEPGAGWPRRDDAVDENEIGGPTGAGDGRGIPQGIGHCDWMRGRWRTTLWLLDVERRGGSSRLDAGCAPVDRADNTNNKERKAALADAGSAKVIAPTRVYQPARCELTPTVNVFSEESADGYAEDERRNSP